MLRNVLGMSGTIGFELGSHPGHALTRFLELALKGILLGLEKLHLLSLAFSGVVGS
jgi:uncharacterized membrane protein (Fun14 family)